MLPSREAASSAFTAIWSQKAYEGTGYGGAEQGTIVYVVLLLVCLAAVNLCIGLRSHRHLQRVFFAFWELHSPVRQYEVQYRKGLNPRARQLLRVCTDGVSHTGKLQHEQVQPSFMELSLKHQVWLVLDGRTSLGSEEEQQVGRILLFSPRPRNQPVL